MALLLCVKLRKTWGKQRCMSGRILPWHVSPPAAVCNQEENELLSTRLASFFSLSFFFFFLTAGVWEVAQSLCPYTLNKDHPSMTRRQLFVLSCNALCVFLSWFSRQKWCHRHQNWCFWTRPACTFPLTQGASELLGQSHRQTLMSFISISIRAQCNSIEISCTGMTADP